VLGVQSAHLVAAPAAAIISARSELAEDAEFDSHPAYSFTYSVDDVSTGDHKSQTETRNGDVVSGQVSFFFIFTSFLLRKFFKFLRFFDTLRMSRRAPSMRLQKKRLF
jgi:hypothetical protein